MIWNDENVERLKALWLEGLSASQIGRALGCTRNAALGKAHRMNLASRAPDPQRARTPRAPYVPVVRKPPEPPVEAEPPMMHDGEFVTVLTVKDGMCRWPIGDPGEEGFHFCAHPPKENGVYCEPHARRSYQPQQPRRVKIEHTGKQR